MKELRILNGCKKGVSFILDDEPIKIGTSLTSELVIQDQGICTEHIEISLNDEEHVCLVPLKGKITNVRGEVSRKSMVLKEGVPFQLGATWFVTQDLGKPWPKRLPKVIKKDVGSGSLLPQIAALRHRLGAQKIIIQGVVISLVLIGINTLALPRHESASEHQDPAESVPETLEPRRSALKQPDTLTESIEVSPVDTMLAKVEPDDPARKIREMLEERELHNVRVMLSNGEVIISGKLDAAERMVLARTLFRYEHEYPHLLPIIDSTQELAEELPFAISSIVTGPFGHITTRDGQRMSVGQTKQGFTLVSIEDGLLTFDGEQRVEVKW